jgi:hypothetical protein
MPPMDRSAVERGVARLLQGGLLIILGVGLAARNVSVTINAGLALLVTLLPAMLERDFRIHLKAGLSLFVTVAVFLHAVGMLGLYDAVFWWDHLTHTLSAMIVAGVGYTVVVAVDEHSEAITVPETHLFAVILGFTLLAGLLWEGLEFGARLLTDALGVEVIWVHYGPGDTALDLLFDAVGAVIVALFGTRRLRSTADSVREWLDDRRGVE